MTICEYYSYNNAENESSLPAQFQLARAGIASAVLSGGTATLIIFIEFLFSRVCCSRTIDQYRTVSCRLDHPFVVCDVHRYTM